MSSSDEAGPSGELVPARGNIELIDVVVNQGVDVPVAHEGVWVEPADRNTYVVAKRDTLIRAFWTIPDDWTPRDITARLELDYPGTDENVFRYDTKFIDGESYPGDFNRGFVFDLLGPDVPPGVKFHVTLWEGADEGWESLPESDTILEAPTAGLEFIGVQPEPAEIKVVMVPFAYNVGTCSTDTSQLTDVQKQEFVDYMYEMYPVESVDIDFRTEAIPWNQPLESLSDVWQDLQELRSADNAAPNVYYHALISPCVGGIPTNPPEGQISAAGLAPGTPGDGEAEAFMRHATSIFYDQNPDPEVDNYNYSYFTVVHEIGHNHGRSHTPCADGQAMNRNPDPTYPHDKGVIGVWGFALRHYKIYSPSGTYDYMSYCNPTWASDWTWSKTYQRIRTLTSWDYPEESPLPAPETGAKQEVLVGIIHDSGTEHWWTAEGDRADEAFNSAQTLQFNLPDGAVDMPASFEDLHDGTHMIVARIPADKSELQSISRIDEEGLSHTVTLDAAKDWKR